MVFCCQEKNIYGVFCYHALAEGLAKSTIFREGQKFTFTEEKQSEVWSVEWLLKLNCFSVACTIEWQSLYCSLCTGVGGTMCFSRDYSDIPKQLLDVSEDKNMLKAISDYAKTAILVGSGYVFWIW